MEESGIVLVFSAPSGAGKTTILRKVMNEMPEVVFSISSTTREPRESEVEGRDYYFVTLEEFRKKIEDDAFLEWVQLHGHYYGTEKTNLEKLCTKGKVVIIEADTTGAMNLKKVLDCATVFIMPPDMKQLSDQLKKRKTETQKSIHDRLKKAPEEMKRACEYDYLIVNHDSKEAALKAMAIITAEKSRVNRNIETINKIIEEESK